VTCFRDFTARPPLQGEPVTDDDFTCDAYGPDPEVRAAGARCFFAEPGKRVCASLAECREKMTAERQRVWQRIQDGAARGEPDMVFLAGEFSGPEQLLGGGAAGDESTDERSE
jgi:hypothetical protein